MELRILRTRKPVNYSDHAVASEPMEIEEKDEKEEKKDAYQSAARKRSASAGLVEAGTPKRRRRAADAAAVLDVSELGETPVLDLVEARSADDDDAIYMPNEMWATVLDFIVGPGAAVPMKGLCMQVCRQWRDILALPKYWTSHIMRLKFVAPVERNQTDEDRAIATTAAYPLFIDTRLMLPIMGTARDGYHPRHQMLPPAAVGLSGRPKYVVYEGSTGLIHPHIYLEEHNSAGELAGRFGLHTLMYPPSILLHTDEYRFVATVATRRAHFPFLSLSVDTIQFDSVPGDEEVRYYVNVDIDARQFDAYVNAHAADPIDTDQAITLRFLGELLGAKNRAIVASETGSEKKGLFIGDRPSLPVHAAPLLVQPRLMVPEIQLHRYQREAMSWMQHTEQRAAGARDGGRLKMAVHARLRFLHGGSTTLIHPGDYRTARTMSAVFESADVAPCADAVHAKGAIFADEMGLGKTMTAIAHAMTARPATPSSLCTSESGNRRRRPWFNKEVGNLLATRATLVVVPNHLPAQWRDEIAKALSASVRVVTLTTAADHAAVTYGDVMRADFVIATANFLTNRSHYVGLLREVKTEKHGASFVDVRQKRFADRLRAFHDACATDASHAAQFESGTQPLLELFDWRRIYLDEGHELVTDTALLQVLHNVSARFYWYLSGTPLPSMRVFAGALAYLRVQSSLLSPGGYNARNNMLDVRNATTLFAQEVLTDLGRLDFANSSIGLYARAFWQPIFIVGTTLVMHLLWRHTKASMRDSLEIPAPHHVFVPLDFSPTERLAYDGYMAARRHVRAYMLCISPLSGDTTADTTMVLASIYERSLGQKMPRPRGRAVGYSSDDDDADDDAMVAARAFVPVVALNELKVGAVAMLESDLEELTREIDRARDAHADKCRLLAEELALFPTLGPVDPAGVKLATLQGHGVSNHQMEYLDHQIATRDARLASHLALMHRQSVVEEYVARLVSMPAVAITEATPTDERLQAQLGTKLAGVISYLMMLLANDREARVLLFSHSDAMLGLVAALLDREGVGNTFVRGNVHRKQKALREFKRDGSTMRVLMLSIKSAASGMNLVEASHVVLVDATPETSTSAVAQVRQAIGRAYRKGQDKVVQVVHFAVRDTREEQLVRANMDAITHGATVNVKTVRAAAATTAGLVFVEEFHHVEDDDPIEEVSGSGSSSSGSGVDDMIEDA